MSDIKVKENKKGTIKTINKAVVRTQKIKKMYQKKINKLQRIMYEKKTILQQNTRLKNHKMQ